VATNILENYLRNVKAFLRIGEKGGESLLFERIERRCNEMGISIARLEKETGLGNATVRGWKKSVPSVENLIRVARRLGTSVEELMKEE